MRQTHTGTQKPLPSRPDQRLSSPSTARNIEPIVAVMRQTMPADGEAVELASGTGEHCVRFAAEFPSVTWTPTDVDAQRLDSIRAWIKGSGLSNFNPPMALNAEQPDWPFAHSSMDAAVVVNLLHLVSQDVAVKLFAGVANVLRPGGQWFLYGPFTRGGEFVSEGDRAFHQQLVSQDPAIGYKDTATVTNWASTHGLTVAACHNMPANNLMFVLKKAG